MKTGYTEASGHNLVTSAVRDGVRLIGVVLGAGSNAERDVHMAALLNQGFAEMDVPIDHHPTREASTPGLVGVAHAATAEPAPRPTAPHARTAGAPGGGLGGPAAGANMVTHDKWGVQVGVYAKEKAAREAAAAARRLAENGEPRVEPATAHGRPAWRAQVTGLTAPEAQGTCATLSRHGTPCLVLRPEVREVASR
jgi:D-alanyl-D-alanine carboxypeptidase